MSEEIEALKKERDELVAQCERLRAGMNQAIELLVTAIHEPEQITEGEIHDLRTLERETPAASLAHVRAEAIEEAVGLYAHKWSDELAGAAIDIMRGGQGYIYPEGLLDHAATIRKCASNPGGEE